MKKIKVAFVVARYGEEINGGAELHCRLIAERLQGEWDCEILTTCAQDYVTWENVYAEGKAEVRGLSVRRFSCDHPRPVHAFNSTYNLLVNLHLLKDFSCDMPLDTHSHCDTLLKKMPPPHHYATQPQRQVPLNPDLVDRLEDFWMRAQGPYSAALLNFVQASAKHYDLFVFFSYNYCTTFYGLPSVSQRSLLVPTLHQEACSAFWLFQGFMAKPAYFLFNSPEERDFAHKMYPAIAAKPQTVVGVGYPTLRLSEKGFAANKFKLKKPYLLYVGRIEGSKGCLELIQYFLSYKQRYPEQALSLVLVGKSSIALPNHPDLIPLGFVSEEDKAALLQEATVFVMPSPYESLSLALLEAWSLGKASLVNGHCEVLKGHCQRSDAGLAYYEETSFHTHVQTLVGDAELRQKLGAKGQKYVEETYRWDCVLEKYREAARQVLRG